MDEVVPETLAAAVQEDRIKPPLVDGRVGGNILADASRRVLEVLAEDRGE